MPNNQSIVTATPPNLIGQFSPEFNKNSFDASVWNKGYLVTWERACECPCRNDQNQPLLTCQNCLGKGWFFINPIETKALIHSINKETKMKSWSLELLGTVSVTMRDSEGVGTARMGYMDRITLRNTSSVENKSVYSQVLRVREDSGQKFLFLAYKPINILDIWAYTSDSSKLYKLNSAIDYEISSDNPYIVKINLDTWGSFNDSLSIQYEHEVQYHVIDLPHDIRSSYVINTDGKEEQILLPINAIARRAHNVFDVPDYGQTGILDNSYLQEKTRDLLSSNDDVLSSDGQVKSGDTKY